MQDLPEVLHQMLSVRVVRVMQGRTAQCSVQERVLQASLVTSSTSRMHCRQKVQEQQRPVQEGREMMGKQLVREEQKMPAGEPLVQRLREQVEEELPEPKSQDPVDRLHMMLGQVLQQQPLLLPFLAVPMIC